MRSLSCSGGSPARLPVSFFILPAVRQQVATVSPIRPIACESDEYMLRTPRSCRTSSAASVSARMRDCAKAMSSGAAVELLGGRLRAAAVALAEQADVDRQLRGRLEHAGEVPRTGRTGRASRTVRGAGAAADQRGDPVREGVWNLVGGEEMNVG